MKKPGKKQKTGVEHREQQITPYLLYRDVGKAMKWLSKAFGFVPTGDQFADKKGKLLHAAMRISRAGDLIMMGCPGPKYQNPKKLGTVTVSMYVVIDNADKHYQRAKTARARILEKPADTFYGDRRYGAVDPEGHQWFFAQHVRDVSKKEMEEALKNR